jgi:hypothetical protein
MVKTLVAYLCLVSAMKKLFFIHLFILVLIAITTVASAQCSICTRTTSQLGEKPARGLNAGILYLAAAPITIVGLIGYRWWKRNGQE